MIPTYRVKAHISGVIASIGPEVDRIYVVDDRCPEESGKFIEAECRDPRVRVVYNEVNMGVGGAVITGYRTALNDGADIVVKMDGDGQMDARFLPALIKPLLNGEADYAKGNRFSDLRSLRKMPRLRIFGNSILSLVNKFVNGYWNIMDPTNGYTAIHRQALSLLDLDRISKRYFFESDMLFRLGIIRAVVTDIPMPAVYGTEKSSLNIGRVFFSFPPKYLNRYFKRIFYNYFLRDFNVGTIQLLFGLILFFGGLSFGIYEWIQSINNNTPATPGTVMIAALPTILGFQLMLSALQYDINNIPQKPLNN